MGRFDLNLRSLWSYIKYMATSFKDGMYKIITYVSTPLHGLIVLASFPFILLLTGDFSGIFVYGLMGMLCFVVLVTVLILIIDPKRLQFTGKEIIVWEQLKLGDSESGKQYLLGEVEGLVPRGQIEDKLDGEK